MKKAFLITGGAGFLGSHLAGRLLEGGNTVCVLDHLVTPEGTHLAVAGFAAHAEYIRANVTNLSQIQPVFRRAWDGVFHLAAQPISLLSNKYPEQTMRVNVEGTRNVCQAAEHGSVGSVVLASSACRYGLPEHGAAPLREDDPARPGFYKYSESKVAAERVFSEGDTPRAIGRFVNVYGPGDRHFSRVIPRFTRSLIRNEALALTRGTGGTVLDYLYVDDAVDALIALYVETHSRAAAHTGAEVFNFGVAGNHPVTVTALARLMSVEFDGRVRELRIPADPIEPPVTKYLDPSKAHQRLGWHAKVSLAKGLPTTMAWYRSHLHQLHQLEDRSLPES